MRLIEPKKTLSMYLNCTFNPLALFNNAAGVFLQGTIVWIGIPLMTRLCSTGQ